MSTAQIESVLVEHAHVAEAAVVPVAHAIKAGFPYIQRNGNVITWGVTYILFMHSHLIDPKNSFIKKMLEKNYFWPFFFWTL